MRPVSPPLPDDLTCRVVTGTTADVTAIVSLVESAYRGESSRAGWTTEADLVGGRRTDADEVNAALAHPEGAVLLAEDRTGVLVGCCHVQRRVDPPLQAEPGAMPTSAGAYFGMFAVRPERQGAGVGAALLGAAERHAVDAWGAAWMELMVIAQRDELIEWYRRRGYHPTSRTRPFPYDDRRFGEPLRPDLFFVVLRRALV